MTFLTVARWLQTFRASHPPRSALNAGRRSWGQRGLSRSPWQLRLTARWPASHVASAEHSSTLKTRKQSWGLPETSSLCCKHPVSPLPPPAQTHMPGHIHAHTLTCTHPHILSPPPPSLTSSCSPPSSSPSSPLSRRTPNPPATPPISQAPAEAWHLPPAQERAQHRRQNELSAPRGRSPWGRNGRGREKQTLAEKKS